MLYLLLVTICASIISFVEKLTELRQAERDVQSEGKKKKGKTIAKKTSKLRLLPSLLTLLLAITAAIVQFNESEKSDLVFKDIQETGSRILGSEVPPSIVIESHPALGMYMTPKTEKSFHEDSIEFRGALRFYLVNDSINTLRNVMMFFDHGNWLEQREKVRKIKGVDPLKEIKLKSTFKTETIEFHDIQPNEKKHFDYYLPLRGYAEFKFKVRIEWNGGSYVVNLTLKPSAKFPYRLDTYDNFRNNFIMELTSLDFESLSTKEKPKITTTYSSESFNTLITPD